MKHKQTNQVKVENYLESKGSGTSFQIARKLFKYKSNFPAIHLNVFFLKPITNYILLKTNAHCVFENAISKCENNICKT